MKRVLVSTGIMATILAVALIPTMALAEAAKPSQDDVIHVSGITPLELNGDGIVDYYYRVTDTFTYKDILKSVYVEYFYDAGATQPVYQGGTIPCYEKSQRSGNWKNEGWFIEDWFMGWTYPHLTGYSKLTGNMFAITANGNIQ